MKKVILFLVISFISNGYAFGSSSQQTEMRSIVQKVRRTHSGVGTVYSQLQSGSSINGVDLSCIKVKQTGDINGSKIKLYVDEKLGIRRQVLIEGMTPETARDWYNHLKKLYKQQSKSN